MDLQTVFHFKGKPKQIHRNYVVIQDFITYSLTAQTYEEGMVIHSISPRDVWVKEKGGRVVLEENGQ